jgi:hypothetical protein
LATRISPDRGRGLAQIDKVAIPSLATRISPDRGSGLAQIGQVAIPPLATTLPRPTFIGWAFSLAGYPTLARLCFAH